MQPLTAAQQRVLGLLHRRGRLSRRAVARQLGVSPSGITEAVAGLIAAGAVQEVARRNGPVGRPSTLLDINEEFVYAVGVTLAGDALHPVLIDLAGNLVDELARPFPSCSAVGCVLESTRDAVWELLRKHQTLTERVCGIGIGLTGLVDGASSLCRLSVQLGWQDLDLAPLLKQHFALPVFVSNDANALAQAEHLFGVGRDEDHLVVISTHHGIGAGLITQGNLYEGAWGSAGEIGHFSVAGVDRPCSCGKSGCLETVASPRAILAELARSARPMTIEQASAALTAGDPEVRRIAEEAASALGLAVSYIAALVNPGAIVLCGSPLHCNPIFVEAFRRAALAHTLPAIHPHTKILVDAASDRIWSRGAASLALRRFLGEVR